MTDMLVKIGILRSKISAIIITCFCSILVLTMVILMTTNVTSTINIGYISTICVSIFAICIAWLVFYLTKKYPTFSVLTLFSSKVYVL